MYTTVAATSLSLSLDFPQGSTLQPTTTTTKQKFHTHTTPLNFFTPGQLFSLETRPCVCNKSTTHYNTHNTWETLVVVVVLFPSAMMFFIPPNLTHTPIDEKNVEIKRVFLKMFFCFSVGKNFSFLALHGGCCCCCCWDMKKKWREETQSSLDESPKATELKKGRDYFLTGGKERQLAPLVANFTATTRDSLNNNTKGVF